MCVWRVRKSVDGCEGLVTLGESSGFEFGVSWIESGMPSGPRSMNCDAGISSAEAVFKAAEGSGIRNALMDCSVPRDGFNKGLVVVSHVRRCLMNFLSTFFLPPLLPSFDMLPLSSAYRHRIARATPTERSLPVGQHTSIVPISSIREEKKAGRYDICVRRSRDPSFPTPHWRCRYFLFKWSGLFVVSGSEVHPIITSNGEISIFELEETKRLGVGITNMGFASGPFSCLTRLVIKFGKSSSFVLRRISLFGQNSFGVKPRDHASWSSAAPWMYPPSEPSPPCTRRDAVHKTTG